ncbi:transcriptional regulator, GntR family with aminotransferase domain [Paenibacillus curdlanolyticus YK9]|uniref:Transcriptional regulator, GntR family with aminotransferase domain n=1 Tax=Paenibacillus curdlanolyticus YK9 TaxID=717606 RepID=E0IA34_9BACL|nr:PLP-dependent aminotransferase family protein [Paenibacillus curdlanolyticus]EFM10611.1 transcriptional regulator, GntR family with aminotransferase domain [Paenibacillus curdlanolyticus YK9]
MTRIELSLAFHEDGPLYQQLYAHIRDLIQNGSLSHGTKMPSIRSLGSQLNISKTTVETAYHMLLDEGYLQSRERSGLTVINPQPAKLTGPATRSRFADVDLQHATTPAACKPAFIDFSLLAIDGDSFPLRLWKSVLADALEINSQSIHQYGGDPFGESSLRESLASYLRHSRGVDCLPEQIVIGTGFSYSIQLLSRLFGEHIHIGIEEPGIAQVRPILSQNGVQLVPYSLERDTLRWREPFNLLYATPAHRPDGTLMPYAQRQQLLQWARSHQGYIIEDDYDGELRLSGKPVPSLQSLDKEEAVIYIGTFSKMFTPALRLNYTIFPLHLLGRLRSVERTLSPPSRLEQWAMQLFIARGHWYRHIRRMRKLYQHKYDRLAQLLLSTLPKCVQITAGGAGLHLELAIATETKPETLIQLAQKEGVLVYGSQDAYSHASRGTSKIYLGFGGLTSHQMELGVQLLKKAWSQVL